MERKIIKELVEWKENKHRKPLILRGARQVGKTYILKEFGKRYYKNVAYFNFDYNIGLQDLFKKTKDPSRLLEQLAILNGEKIEKKETLIIFDEIQECTEALNSLKYFHEMANEYHIACAGSLLGIRLSHTSFPVGKVDFLDMYPMTFSEFLEADNANNLSTYLKSIDKIESIPDVFFTPLEEKFKIYFIVGGMPEVVSSWVEEKDINKVNKIQEAILRAYESDFSKHVSNSEGNKISLVWNSIPSQLARENKKFLYQTIKEGARAREYEDALNWLKDANLINKIYLTSKNALPLVAYNDLSAFKIFLGDVGLLRKMANLDSRIIIENNKLFEEFKGSLTENYVANTLSMLNGSLNYYTFDRFEIDYMIQLFNEIIPIEVKAGTSTKNRSLTKYIEKYNPKVAVRLSLNNLKVDDNVINIPLFLTEYIDKIIDIYIKNNA